MLLLMSKHRGILACQINSQSFKIIKMHKANIHQILLDQGSPTLVLGGSLCLLLVVPSLIGELYIKWTK